MEKIVKTERQASTYEVMPLGFHGDTYLIDLVDKLVKNCGITTFIETGANVGSSLRFFANKYPNIDCLSCEPDEKAFEIAVKETKGIKNVMLKNLTSEIFLKTEECKSLANNPEAKILFWLDAHGYGFRWPIQDEFNYIFGAKSENFVLVDDYLVPNRKEFGYDLYEDQICSHEFIFSNRKERIFELYYPDYIEKTSSFHPLRGWGLYFVNTKAPKSISNLNYIDRAKISRI